MMLKVVLPVYILITVIIGVSFWLNPKAPANVTQIGTLLGAAVLTFLSIIPFWSVDKREKKYAIVFFRDPSHQALILGSYGDPYEVANRVTTQKLTLENQTNMVAYTMSSKDDKYLIQKGILQALLSTFEAQNWDAEPLPEEQYPSDLRVKFWRSSDVPFDEISTSQLKRIFITNEFVQGDFLSGNFFRVPKGVKISYIEKDGGWSITMENSKFAIVISLMGITESNLRGGAWGVFRGDDSQINRFSQSVNSISIVGRTKMFARYPELIDSYWMWFENISEILRDLSWKKIDEETERKWVREAIWKDVSIDEQIINIKNKLPNPSK